MGRMPEKLNPIIEKPARDAWQAAIDFGIDVSSIDERLAMTPAERLRRHDRALLVVRAMRTAGIRYYGFDPRSSEEAH